MRLCRYGELALLRGFTLSPTTSIYWVTNEANSITASSSNFLPFYSGIFNVNVYPHPLLTSCDNSLRKSSCYSSSQESHLTFRCKNSILHFVIRASCDIPSQTHSRNISLQESHATFRRSSFFVSSMLSDNCTPPIIDSFLWLLRITLSTSLL